MSLLNQIRGKDIADMEDAELEELLADIRSQKIPKVNSTRKRVSKKNKAELAKLLDLLTTAKIDK